MACRLRTLGAAVPAVGLLLGGAACSSAEPQVERRPPAPPSKPAAGPLVRDDLQAVFRQAGVRGTLAVLDVDRGQSTLVDRRRAGLRLIPASTFKIPHSLIALETGAVKDAAEVIPYGGKPQWRPEWERDMNLRDAIRLSNVAVFQTLARRIGVDREKQWLARLGYGNRQTGTAIGRFWIDGPLEISATEQTGFLSRLARHQLPASQHNQRVVRDLLRIERKNGYALYAKTGWTNSVKPGIGWWTGWVERAGHVHAFALNLDVKDRDDIDKRVPLGRALLQRLGILPAS